MNKLYSKIVRSFSKKGNAIVEQTKVATVNVAPTVTAKPKAKKLSPELYKARQKYLAILCAELKYQKHTNDKQSIEASEKRISAALAELNNVKNGVTSKPTAPAIKEDRNTHYQIKNEYVLMFWQGKAWIKSARGSGWSWLTSLSSTTFNPKHIDADGFNKLLKEKLSYKQLQGQYKIYTPSKLDFPIKESGKIGGDSWSNYQQMHAVSSDMLNTKIVKID